MHIDKNTKDMQKGYCKTVLASQGKLTKDLFDKINNGDEAVIRQVFKDQQQRINNEASKISDLANKEVTLTQVDSIQEVLDCLTEILNA
jgi:vacuolar-type H+-ATPase subunit H